MPGRGVDFHDCVAMLPTEDSPLDGRHYEIVTGNNPEKQNRYVGKTSVKKPGAE